MAGISKAIREELNQRSEAVKKLWEYAHQVPVTLLYGAHNQVCHHAVALKAYITRQRSRTEIYSPFVKDCGAQMNPVVQQDMTGCGIASGRL